MERGGLEKVQQRKKNLEARGSGNSSVSVLATQTQGPEFDSQHPGKRQVVKPCNPRAVEETGGFLGLTVDKIISMCHMCTHLICAPDLS